MLWLIVRYKLIHAYNSTVYSFTIDENFIFSDDDSIDSTLECAVQTALKGEYFVSTVVLCCVVLFA